MTQHTYTPWLSGHCLLLLDDQLTAQERDDALDVQLFAWLKANEDDPLFADEEAWQGRYRAAQNALGWAFSYSDRATGKALTTASTPLQLLLAPLFGKVPASRHAALRAAVDGLQALPANHPALQALRAEAVQDAPGRIACELRVVQPHGQLVASSLYLSTPSVDPHWLVTALAPHAVEDLRTSLCVVEVLEATFATVRPDLRNLLHEERLAYTTRITPRGPAHG